ncbi:MAG TPA: transporter substrate-binding domain-containing protein, partial [Burkholderiaceae bacterium]|nr:transporter substrate-binding domain-containing protein [Burkholderiaceae bacterium]
NQAKIDQAKTIADLRKLTFGQGIGWGDVALYQRNGIDVYTSNYDLLFKMVSYGRFDLFPRGINEIFSEYNIYSKDNPNLAIEKNLLIYYPWPYYFFFNKRDAALKKRVETGIKIMMHDGSFDAIFRKYNNDAIEKANLKGRRVIKIVNDMLPKETPLDDASLWFDPAKY